MHPRRKHIHENLTFGQRAAEATAAGIGSWRFLIMQGAFLVAWLIVNTEAAFAWDKPPYILLNLLLSFQAAFTGPVLLIATNRAAQRDRMRDDTEAREVELLYEINQQQLAILTELRQQRQGGQDASPANGRPARDAKTGRYVKASESL